MRAAQAGKQPHQRACSTLKRTGRRRPRSQRRFLQLGHCSQAPLSSDPRPGSSAGMWALTHQPEQVDSWTAGQPYLCAIPAATWELEASREPAFCFTSSNEGRARGKQIRPPGLLGGAPRRCRRAAKFPSELLREAGGREGARSCARGARVPSESGVRVCARGVRSSPEWPRERRSESDRL